MISTPMKDYVYIVDTSVVKFGFSLKTTHSLLEFQPARTGHKVQTVPPMAMHTFAFSIVRLK